MSGGQSLLLVRKGGTVWGVDNGRVSRVTRGGETYRVEVGATPLAADEVLGVVHELEVRVRGRVLRRFWPMPFSGLTVHAGAPVVVVDPDRPPDMLLLEE